MQSNAALSAKSGHRIISIASGMNFWDGQKWTASDPSFQVTPQADAFLANRLQNKVRLSADLGVAAAVTLTLADGAVLQSTPIAIGLIDPSDGRTVIISQLTNCLGVLISTNQVLYENAFLTENGPVASVLLIGCPNDPCGTASPMLATLLNMSGLSRCHQIAQFGQKMVKTSLQRLL
jgi:hypothetical protein